MAAVLANENDYSDLIDINNEMGMIGSLVCL